MRFIIDVALIALFVGLFWWILYLGWCRPGYYQELKQRFEQDDSYGGLSPEATKGLFRCSLPMSLAITTIALIGLTPVSSAEYYQSDLALWILGSLLLAAVSIFFFNRPSLLVPPHLRGEPGAFMAWRRKRKSM